jgi:hypothetical protein
MGSSLIRGGPSARYSLVLVVLLAGCVDPIPDGTVTPPGEGDLHGTVTDLCSSKPLEGVLVTPRPVEDGTPGKPGAATTTGADGRYLLEGLDPGDWQLTLSKQSYQSVEKTVVMTGAQPQQLDVTLAPVPSKLPESAKLDVLFVVDNSNSMAQEQQSLAAAFPRFMNALLLYGFTLDLRVGVISTDLGAGSFGLPSCEATGGDAGKLQGTPRVAGCTPPTDPYISLVNTVSNVPDDMINDAFSCIVQLGTGGCGFEQPLGAVLQAVDGTTNVGFPRKDSVLAVVVVSDEDDCTAADTQLYDPSQSSLSDPLGPLTSFRCFEFGVTCDVNDRLTPGPRKGCKPREGGYLLDVDSFVTKLTQDRLPGQVFFAAIAGPIDTVEVGLDAQNPTVRPSCQTADTVAVPAIRLRAVVERMAPESAFATICVTDLGGTLADLARQIAEKTILMPCS